jgi:hypothetical protein
LINSAKKDPASLKEAYDLYEKWLKDGASGRLHLTEPDGQNICRVMSGRGFQRLITLWRRFCLILAINVSFNVWKIFWYRRAGVTIGARVFISHGAHLDWQAPWLITLEDDCLLGYDSAVAVHTYCQKKLTIKKVVIGRRAVVGIKAIAAASMGDDAILGPGSVLLTQAPAKAVMFGVPAKETDLLDYFCKTS